MQYLTMQFNSIHYNPTSLLNIFATTPDSA